MMHQSDAEIVLAFAHLHPIRLRTTKSVTLVNGIVILTHSVPPSCAGLVGLLTSAMCM
jgi:hypothetical protein